MNTEKKADFYQVLSAIDKNVAELGRARDLLQLFDEQLSENIDILSKGEPWAASYFVDRFRLLRSLLDTIMIQLMDSIGSATETLDEGLAIARKNREIENEG